MNLKINESKCKICNDTGYEYIEKNNKTYAYPCICYFKRIKKHKFGSEYENKTLDNWIPKNESQQAALNIIKQNPTKNYFIWGDVRLGKTHLLAGIYEEMYKAGRWQGINYYTEENLLEEIKIIENFGSRSRRRELEEKIEMGEVRGFIIDDILKGKAKSNDLQIQSMYYFYEAVSKWNCQLIISCNFDLKTVLDAYGAAITARIDERCKSIHIE